MSHSVSQHLRIDVASYDQIIPRFIPGYRELLDRAVAAVARIEPRLVLDLGAGTGALSERLLSEIPGATVELWDVDAGMLAVARGRVERFGDRVRFIQRSFDEPLPSCDAVTASLALHHVPTLPAKTALYRRIAAALRPDGVLVNADVTVPNHAPRDAMFYREWADHLVASGIEERRAWGHFAEWSDEDRYFSVEEELEAMTRGGLQAQCAWQLGPATLLIGQKPGDR